MSTPIAAFANQAKVSLPVPDARVGTEIRAMSAACELGSGMYTLKHDLNLTEARPEAACLG